jgi:hypothetical protein
VLQHQLAQQRRRLQHQRPARALCRTGDPLRRDQPRRALVRLDGAHVEGGLGPVAAHTVERQHAMQALLLHQLQHRRHALDLDAAMRGFSPSVMSAVSSSMRSECGRLGITSSSVRQLGQRRRRPHQRARRP